MELFILWIGLALAAGVVADSKNRGGGGYFLLGLVLPLIALLIAIIVSPVEKQPAPQPWRFRKCPFRHFRLGQPKIFADFT